ncbi:MULTISPECIES: SDR family oxidoreductase [Rhodopseudomonas]|uniref:NAD-dependent epimerase/dehydratase family protein n=1 Tax=Rhodopseudomonas TaxID=1073 RepID=UPI0005CA698E|nr:MULTISPECIES: SDR family oxidoreductase [Rhodopseudomonas]MDF3812586.1 SDR family oxidoreductase [Rhodopseudomonas sp. BAL398]WOK17690.1 SDR family oxidoreductase [Rhodopseudomonas sp. BAL398]
MRVIYTGADGYIGTVLGPKLLARGHQAVGVDTGLYRRGWLFEDGRTRPSVITRDVRLLTESDLEGIDAVVHLAELSNDPLGNNDPTITEEINHIGTVGFATRCRAAGVGRFVFASSCSIYGAAGSEMKTEMSTFDPQTAYARCKVMVERDVALLADSHFTPVFLRNATAFGASPRQRFDLVLNDLAGSAFTAGVIDVKSDGSPCRPLVHIEDICEAILCALEAPREDVCGEAFNVGSDQQNYTVREIANIVHDVFPEAKVTFGASGPDNRSYRVSFAKIRQVMPQFRCRWDARSGAEQLRYVFERIQMDEAVFRSSPFTRLMELKHLRQTRQINPHLLWTAMKTFDRSLEQARDQESESMPAFTTNAKPGLAIAATN